MSFKNALRILISRFTLVWILALYMLILVTIVGLLSLTFVMPVVEGLEQAKFFESVAGIFSKFWEGTASLNAVGEEIGELVDQVRVFFQDNSPLVIRTNVMFFIVLFIYKFVLGFYELPMYRVLDGAMSSDARLGFVNRLVSCIGQSSRFVLVKIIYTTLYDALFLYILYNLLGLFFAPYAILAPLIICVYVIVFQSLRYTLIAFWGQEVTLDGKPIFQSFVSSVKKSGKNFASVFSSFVVMWIVFITLNLFVGIFTFGAGLIATIPMCMLFVCVLNMSLFYNKTGRRHYVDGEIVTPAANLNEK